MKKSSKIPISSMVFSSSWWDYTVLLILRPTLAISFVLLFISIGWFLAWKLVLVHVPLVQEIFGLRKKPPKPRPVTRRLSRYYNARNSAPSGVGEEANMADQVIKRE